MSRRYRHKQPRRNLNGWEVGLIIFLIVLGISYCDMPDTATPKASPVVLETTFSLNQALDK